MGARRAAYCLARTSTPKAWPPSEVIGDHPAQPSSRWRCGWVHSLIQATINFVPLRFLVFATSTLVLMAMTARNLLALIQR